LNERDESIDVALGEAIIDFLVEPSIFNACQLGVKHALCGLEALTANFDRGLVW